MEQQQALHISATPVFDAVGNMPIDVPTGDDSRRMQNLGGGKDPN